jgi:hypothetical protein
MRILIIAKSAQEDHDGVLSHRQAILVHVNRNIIGGISSVSQTSLTYVRVGDVKKSF